MRDIFRAISVACALFALTYSSVLAQTRNTTLSSILNAEVVSLTHWRVATSDGHLLCVVSERRTADGSVTSPPVRTLTVYRQNELKFSMLYRFETEDSILNAYPLGDYDARLFLTWAGGSAYHFRVLAYVGGEVEQVLEASSKLPPEVLYDSQGRESILVTQPEMKEGKWTAADGTTDVFKWNGKAYDELGSVPWAKRFHCVSKETCASAK